MSISRKVFYNVAISSVSKVVSTAAALVGIAFITRYLGQETFGLYATALGFFLFFNAISDWGLYQTTTRKISRPESNEKAILNKVFGLRITISLVIISVTPLLFYFLPYPKELKIALFIVLISSFFSSSYQLIIGLFQKRLLMDRIAIVELVAKLIQVSLIILGVKLDLGFYFIISIILIVMFINFSAALILSRKFIRIKPEFDKKYWKKFIKEAAPIGLSALVTFAYFKADSILLSLLQPASAVGIYGAAYKIVENLSFFPAMIVGLTMPMFSRTIFSDKERFNKIVNANFKVFVILVLPLIGATVLIADQIISVIAGPEFKESAKVLKIVIFSIGLIFFGHLFNNILIAAKLQKDLFWALLICAIFSLTLNLIFIPKFSYFSTASVSVATEALVVILSLSIIYKKIKFLPKIKNLLGIVTSTLVMMSFIHFLEYKIPFLVLIVASPLIYFSCLLLFRAIKKEEIKAIFSK